MFLKLLFHILPLFVAAQLPTILRIRGLGLSDPMNLTTTGGDILVLEGTNFGAAGARLSYSGPSPFTNGLFIGYSPLILFQNDTQIQFRTPPGIGPNLRFTVRNAANATATSAQIAAYRIPVILNITTPAGATAYTKETLRPTGGDLIVLEGTDFGPRTFPGTGAAIYTPTVRFGLSGGTYGWMSCSRTGLTYMNTMLCRVPVGGGTNHTVRIQAGVTGHWSTPNSQKFVSYVTPTLLSTSPTFSRMYTAGGEQIVFRGRNIPYPSWVIAGLCPITGGFGSYTFRACTGAFDADGRTPVITCQSPEGTGRGFTAALTVGVAGFSTNTLVNSSIGYAAPMIYSFDGAAATDANTLGNETVILNGQNFGRNASLITATYTLTLKTPAGGRTNVTYTSSGCNITIAHTQIGCLTVPGVGADLVWSIVVDGLKNVNPTTAYTPPTITALQVTNATTGVSKQTATTQGGDALLIVGSGFGVPTQSLVQSAAIVSPYGFFTPLENYTLLSDTALRVILPPGGGKGWSVAVKVADIPNTPTDANFSYADPRITSITPRTGPTAGGTVITVDATDLVLNQPTLVTAAVFGNVEDGSLWPSYIQTNLVPRADNDTTTKTPYIPGRVSFQIPPGAGTGRRIQLVSYMSKDLPPDITTMTGTPGDGSPTFAFTAPSLLSAVVSQPTSPSQLQFATNFLGPDAVAGGSAKVVILTGANFGLGNFPLTNRQIQTFNSTTGLWTNSSNHFWDPTEWLDSQITIYTLQPSGTLRLWFLSASEQFSNPISYNDLSPLLFSNSTGPFPTVGGIPISLQASYLASATSFNVTVNSLPCPILDPTLGTPLSPSAIYTRILTNPSTYSPAGPFTSSTVWSFQCLLPPGQGSAAPAILTRIPDESPSAPLGLRYTPPQLISLNGQPPGSRFLLPTEGTTLTLSGAHFGPCPTILLATYTLSACSDPDITISSDHTTITLWTPEGEGTGMIVQPPLGWTLSIAAGDQATTPTPIGWIPPTLEALSAPAFPTTGGTTMTLKGSNFGASLPGFPQSLLPPEVQVIVSFQSPYQNTTCSSVQRISHTSILCSLPEGAGRMSVFLSVGGQVSASIGTFSYDAASLSLNSTLHLQTNQSVVLEGANFGADPANSCIFLSNRRFLTRTPICNGLEDYAGEGEIPRSAIRSWNHTAIEFTPPPGSGSPSIQLLIHGTPSLPSPGQFRPLYPPPTLTNISQRKGPSIGGYPVTVWGTGFGGLTRPGLRYPLPLPLEEDSIYYNPLEIRMNGMSAVPAIQRIQEGGTALTFLIPVGIGLNYSLAVSIQDTDSTYTSNSRSLWAYDTPEPQFIRPNPVAVGDTQSPSVTVQGENLGTSQAFVNFPGTDRSIEVSIEGQVQGDPQRIQRNGEDAGIEFILTGSTLTAGTHTLNITVAGQFGLLRNSSLQALQILCEKGYFAKEHEFCLACPVGGVCQGGLAYPFAAPGFFNFNSSYQTGPDAESCPASAQIETRDVCLVACLPSEACSGRNMCALGYRSTAPAYRCNSCDKGFFKRANECIRCPDTPYMLILGACLVVIFIAAVGYWLVKFNVNLVFMSVAIDYFQVVSIFLQSKIQWPAAVKQLMYILSAFNLNLDIVAPECLLPEVSYVDKFYTIQLFPLALLALLGISSAAYTAYKYWILRRTSKEHLYRHVPTNRAVALVILYFFYLYLTKTTLDVYNCAPTVPPTYDSTGKLMKYLSTQFEECGKPGGIQARLIPYSVLALCIYTLGFPAALGWLLYTHRLPIMFDQLLRAKGQGQNRFQNPYAYSIRKSYSRLYYQFKPNFFFWSLVILLRKFLIATTSVMFTTNPSFQMSTCLLILFLSYSLQVRLNPYMSYSDYAVVLEEHQDMQGWSALHRQLHAMLVTVESRNYKKYYKNILVGGRMNRAALLKAIGSWLFNYNTVEAVLLFCGIILCLMGVMLQSQMLDKGGYDTITGVILTILVASILYLFAIFCIEVYIAVTARRHSIHLPHIKTVRFEETGIPPAEMSETNPILLRGKLADQVQIEAFEEAPPKEVWTLFRETFKQQQTTIQDLNGEISAMKKQVSSRSDVVLMDAFRPRTVAIKKEMRTGMVELTPRGMKGISV